MWGRGDVMWGRGDVMWGQGYVMCWQKAVCTDTRFIFKVAKGVQSALVQVTVDPVQTWTHY